MALMFRRLDHILWWTIRSLILGICVGCAMWALNTGVGFITSMRESNPYLILLLPIGALCITLAYEKLGHYLRKGTALVIQMINDGLSGDAYKHDCKSISAKMAPLLFLCTLLSHLVGASTGKEGAGVQIGASIGDYLSHVEDFLLPAKREDHNASTEGIWLIMGAGAAFGALFNAPIAGMLFGLQFSAPGVNRTDAYIPCVVASYTAVIFSHSFLHTPTLTPTLAEYVALTPGHLLELALISIAMGLCCKIFLALASLWKQWLKNHVKSPYGRALASSLILLSLSLGSFPFLKSFPLNGLSANLIGKATAWYMPFLKAIFTILSMGSGFVGGEVIPLLTLGSMLGSLASPLFSLPLSATVSFGSMAMLSAATKLPFVCAILGLELFGFSNPSLLFFTCIISYAVSGKLGIYAKQMPTIALEGR